MSLFFLENLLIPSVMFEVTEIAARLIWSHKAYFSSDGNSLSNLYTSTTNFFAS